MNASFLIRQAYIEELDHDIRLFDSYQLPLSGIQTSSTAGVLDTPAPSQTGITLRDTTSVSFYNVNLQWRELAGRTGRSAVEKARREERPSTSPNVSSELSGILRGNLSLGSAADIVGRGRCKCWRAIVRMAPPP